jgi:hypothetical protein
MLKKGIVVLLALLVASLVLAGEFNVAAERPIRSVPSRIQITPTPEAN